jgi:hypothetical protein
MKRPLALVGSLAVTLGVLSGTLLVPFAGASSHREAPSISRDPVADNNDVYMFRSPDKPDTVTIIATYIPLEEPAGGPNFSEFSEDVLYALNIDNDGDGKEDISYHFRFDSRLRNGNTFLYNTGPITSLSDEDWNLPQTYSVTRVENRNRRQLGSGILTAPVNIGPRSTPDYAALMTAAVKNLGDGRMVFAGQVDDPFFVDLGSVFDLAGLRPFNTLHVIPLPTEPGVDGVAGFNTHAIALQVPISDLTRDHKMHAADEAAAVIGVYASAARQRVTVLRDDGDDSHAGDFVQVSRLAEPLINEVIIPLRHKDRWNRSDPSDDQQFETYYLNPEVTRLANALYPVLDNAKETGRTDLVSILLTGVPTLNFTGEKRADLIRLNTGIAPTAAVGMGNRLGVLAGDLAGFPNGRRLEDDVVDIELRALTEGYGAVLNGLLGLPNRSPNNQLGDGVDANDKSLSTTFPYMAVPHQGYSHSHH